MNKIEQFLNEKFGEVRVVKEGSVLFFVAQDIAESLGYRMASDMTRNLEKDDIHTQTLRTSAGDREFNLITEAGLYDAVLSITKRNKERYELAREFKRWITGEVIPIIRETGGYVEDQREEEFINKYFTSFSDEVKQAMIEDLMKTNKKLTVKADKWNKFLDADSTYSFTEVAKMISTKATEEIGEGVKISGMALTKHLREEGILSKRKHGNSFENLPNKDYEQYFDVISRSVSEDLSKTQTRVKASGVEFIYDKLAESEKFKTS